MCYLLWDYICTCLHDWNSSNLSFISYQKHDTENFDIIRNFLTYRYSGITCQPYPLISTWAQLMWLNKMYVLKCFELVFVFRECVCVCVCMKYEYHPRKWEKTKIQEESGNKVAFNQANLFQYFLSLGKRWYLYYIIKINGLLCVFLCEKW